MWTIPIKIMPISMHVQNLIKFYKTVLKILSGNEIMRDGRNDSQPKSNITPTFSKGAINMRGWVTHFLKSMGSGIGNNSPEYRTKHVNIFARRNVIFSEHFV